MRKHCLEAKAVASLNLLLAHLRGYFGRIVTISLWVIGIDFPGDLVSIDNRDATRF
jgi:hypothetical protein